MSDVATIAGAVAPGEEPGLVIDNDGQVARITFALPANLADRADIFAASAQVRPQAVSAGVFGSGFTLRLARAEARAAGGELRLEGASLILTLPLLTVTDPGHSEWNGAASGGSRSA